ncbi:LPXTG cell wall anchor domain-containing protein [Streptomyces sp. NPDC048337]|uniref:LPXTG cell wall anchor domain-containing protein n=1 Tax=Streptomyces sp. NPDC048337 TaxID=3365535 RepID=UPI003710F0B3
MPVRSAAAAVVTAAVAGTVLMPLSAYAAPTDNAPGLKLELGAPVQSGPLTRGGATETFELTVKNPSDKPAAFHPWLNGHPTGASPLLATDVVYKVEAVDAPATGSHVGNQDGEWEGMFYPAGKPEAGFEVPAGGKLTWKVTIGLGKDYPTNNGDFSLTADSYASEIPEGGAPTITFKSDPAITPGKLNTRIETAGPCETGGDETRCRELKLTYKQTGDGAFSHPLTPFLRGDFDGVGQAQSDLQIGALIDGQWKDLKTDGAGNFRLPEIAKGFGSASGERVVRLRVKLGAKTQVKGVSPLTLESHVGLGSETTWPFASTQVTFGLGPAKPTTPTSPSPTPSGTPSPTASATPSASATATPSASASASTTPTTGGNLAKTGSDTNVALYSGLAAALVALGGTSLWLATRRRRNAGAA